MPKTYSVTEINKYIKHMLDADYELKNIQVQGEISNFKRYGSGHCYFSLKEGGSSNGANGYGGGFKPRYGSINEDGSMLKCVMFKSKALSLSFEPRNGDKVVAVGHISVYERDGVYQLYTDLLLQQGAGDLMLQYEALKAKLTAEGLFEQERKQPLPENARAVGIVTSSSGAAVHDVINVSRRRHPGIKLYLYPVQVQGKGASTEIARGIEFFNRSNLVDVLIVGRGGGSIEDLWAFNEEPTVRAVAASHLPIISAVGHETDYTLCDFAADVRAATPSQAAEMAVSDISKLRQQHDNLAQRLKRAMQLQLDSAQTNLAKLQQSRMLQEPSRLYATKAERLARLQASYLLQDPRRLYAAQEERLKRLAGSNMLQDPRRLYAAQEERLKRLISSHALQSPRRLYILQEQQLRQVLSSWIFKEPQRLFAEKMQRLDMAHVQLVDLIQQQRQDCEHRLKLNQAKLEAISPYEVFKRGYSCVRNSQKKIISSVEEVRWGDEIRTSLRDGQIISIVQEVERR